MQAVGERDDEWLMDQVARGQREQLAPLVRRYANRLLTFIRRLVGDEHQSEELFQEVFLAVWVNRHRYSFPPGANDRCRPAGPAGFPVDHG